ncbi:ABC transporter ATP-binding protein [Bacillus horti]|uniref:ABC-2 type transport system ATP-binding protein n=1 Tax=Caldalkalibacillus horti TaxID=77523 RepID=A0ABT9W3L8_9BACI|nr:ABC transporter ATP-binding protein [Bacillus horti]MDQ0167842.1 ABC-2 type transport system ATP-binding protein [Bacillus horti]
MLSVENLSKKIENQQVLDHVSFTIKKGSITALLGRNGVGKTTLLQTIVGILDADTGKVLYNDQSIQANPGLKQDIVFIPDSNALFKNYSVKEIISFYDMIYPNFNQKKLFELLNKFNLPQQGMFRSFSKGTRAMFFIAVSFSTQAKVIILDEPTNGLDPIIKKQMLQHVIEEVAENDIALLLSTHHLNEVETIADHVLFMKEGRIAEQVSLEELNQRMKKIQIAFKEVHLLQITNLKGVKLLQQSGRVLTLLLAQDTANAMEILESMNPILLEELPLTLEDLFVHTLGGELDVV